MVDTTVGNGQVSTGAVLNAGDRQVVQSETFNASMGGRAIDTTINDGGQQFLQYGSSTNTFVATGGTQYVYGTGTSSATILNGGSQIVSGSYDQYNAGQPNPNYTYGHANGTIVNSGGVQQVQSFSSATVVNDGGVQFVNLSGDAFSFQGAVNSTTVNAGGSQFLYSGSAVGTHLNTGGSLLFSQSDFTVPATLTFNVQTNTLNIVDGQTNIDLKLSGDYSMTGFTIGENGSYDTFSNLIKVTAVPLCFCAGVHIATPEGDVAVENLRVGGKVVTLGGKVRPIRWIGETSGLVNDDNRPVIVRADAFGPSMPLRDVRVTRGHSFLFRDVLIPIGSLVNGISIIWDKDACIMRVFHIELDVHDILLADGSPAESYRDDGNRSGFTRARGNRTSARSLSTCFPIVSRGPVVERTRRRLAERAMSCSEFASGDRIAA